VNIAGAGIDSVEHEAANQCRDVRIYAGLFQVTSCLIHSALSNSAVSGVVFSRVDAVCLWPVLRNIRFEI
jgi:hypothetical protein